MNDLRVVSLSPFVPSGKEYAASRRLFADLGFEETWEQSGCAGFRNGDVKFIPQNYDHAVFAQNLMIRLDVPDLDAWWQAVSERNLEQKYPGLRINAPKDFPWGREIHLIDLAGVCWHIGQA